MIEDKVGEYAIIVENKIHGATDGKKQITKYIEKCKKNGFKDKQIYVLYLTKDGGSPSKNSLSEKLKDEFKEMYKEIDYKSVILPWLEEFILPNCRVKDVTLISAVQQYINYLQGMFLRRISEQSLYNELKINLQKKLEIEGNIYKKIDSLKQHIEIINKNLKEDDLLLRKIDVVHNYLNEIYKDIIIELFEEWYNEINKECQNPEIISNVLKNGNWKNKIADKYLYLGVKLSYNEADFTCAIGFDHFSSEPYYGLTFRGCGSAKNKEIIDFVKNNYENKYKDSTRWYAYKNSNLKSILDNYIEFYDEIIEKMKK